MVGMAKTIAIVVYALINICTFIVLVVKVFVEEAFLVLLKSP